ncbi:ABC transporter G family member 42-like [Iris pallida]|uniref:ABC transporter G family member 42-like n=1 Tax=Iris pallida TaxID=29817 RepID=A0AAX6GEF7_IRIPA|nr:ABC transporter G family member 42-like [Iris pallida]
MSFAKINYCVNMPVEIKEKGMAENKLQVLKDVTGSFRPGILTALMGVSRAGKTNLMDVLAGRKTGGYIEGGILISGFPNNQSIFARISGYCEQNDVHSSQVIVRECLISLHFSVSLRNSMTKKRRLKFVDEVMELVELHNLKDSIVGLPGVTGLSTEHRKRLIIVVELVANPSNIFMDEPTSGLEARAVAIVIRTVRNTVETGRIVVCSTNRETMSQDSLPSPHRRTQNSASLG